MPRLWCTCKGSTGSAMPMMRKPMNTTVMIGSSADVAERAIAMDGSDVVANIIRRLSIDRGPDEILLRLRLVAGHAAIRLTVRSHRLVRIERLEFPLAIAQGGRVTGAPAGALLHDDVAIEIGWPFFYRLDRLAVGED